MTFDIVVALNNFSIFIISGGVMMLFTFGGCFGGMLWKSHLTED